MAEPAPARSGRTGVSEHPTLGALVITRNEEANIARCLRSVSFADRVLVVDSFSTDRTVEIARSLGADVRSRAFAGYSEQKTFALSQLDTEWVLWIDADEEVSPALREDIVRALHSPPDIDGHYVPRLVVYLGREMRHGGWYPDPKLRLFRRTRGRFDGRLVHEGVIVEGRTGRLRGELRHFPYRDRAHHLEKVERYAALAAQQLRVEGRQPSWLDERVRPIARFLRMWIVKGGFLDGRAGFAAAVMGARYVARKYRLARRGAETGEA